MATTRSIKKNRNANQRKDFLMNQYKMVMDKTTPRMVDKTNIVILLS